MFLYICVNLSCRVSKLYFLEISLYFNKFFNNFKTEKVTEYTSYISIQIILKVRKKCVSLDSHDNTYGL